MLINDLALYFRDGIIATTAKMVRIQIPDKMQDYIEENHLYHVTPDAETAEKIVDSEYLKPATGMFKNINSYGTASACMFAGTPDINNYIKNLTDSDLKRNPYLNPTMISSAVEIDISKNELKNYKVRGFADNAVVCEGYCMLPKR